MARRNKVKLAFIENISKRKISYYKRLKGFLNKIHELNVLCDVELVVIIYSLFHDEPKVFPNRDAAINICSKFKEFSEFEKSKKMVTQEKFTKQSIEKIKKKLQKVKKENRVCELTNKMYELLNGKDFPVGMQLNNLNDLSYVIDQNLKKVNELIKAKLDEENPTSNAPKPIVGQMEFGGTNSEEPRAPLLIPSSASISVAPLTVPDDGTNVDGITTPMLVPGVDPISMSPFATLSNISSVSSTHVAQPMFDPVTPYTFSSQMFSPTVPQPMMAPLTPVPVSPQMDPSMNNEQNYSVDFPESPALSELFDWLLDD